jgi:hypothetical protein
MRSVQRRISSKHREKVTILTVSYGKIVRRIFFIDISLEPLEQFQQINRYFKERLKVYLLCKNIGSGPSKRDIDVIISLNVFQRQFL